MTDEDQDSVFLPAMNTPNQISTNRRTPNANSDLRTIDKSDRSNISNIVGGNVLPFKLPLRFGAPTQRESDMNTRGTTDEFARTPNLPGRFGKGGG